MAPQVGLGLFALLFEHRDEGLNHLMWASFKQSLALHALLKIYEINFSAAFAGDRRHTRRGRRSALLAWRVPRPRLTRNHGEFHCPEDCWAVPQAVLQARVRNIATECPTSAPLGCARIWRRRKRALPTIKTHFNTVAPTGTKVQR